MSWHGQCAKRHGNGACCYSELVISFQMLTVFIAPTHWRG